MKLAARGVVKLLKRRRIRFTNDPKPKQSFQVVRVTSRRLPVRAIALSSRTIGHVTLSKTALQRFEADTNISERLTSNPFSRKEVSPLRLYVPR